MLDQNQINRLNQSIFTVDGLLAPCVSLNAIAGIFGLEIVNNKLKLSEQDLLERASVRYVEIKYGEGFELVVGNDEYLHYNCIIMDRNISVSVKEVKEWIQTQKDVHTEHCCVNCGCKYRDENCSVVLGLKEQSYPCSDNCH